MHTEHFFRGGGGGGGGDGWGPYVWKTFANIIIIAYK